MTIRKKLGCLLAILVILFLLFVLVAEYSYTVNISPHFFPITNNPRIIPYLSNIIFWLSLIVFCLVLAIGIVIFFIPTKKKNLLFVLPNGTLNLSLKSIENFVMFTVTKDPVIIAPQVKVYLTKKNLKVKILGYLGDSENLIGHSDEYALKIQDSLNQLLGEHNMNLFVTMKMKDYKQNTRRKNILARHRVD